MFDPFIRNLMERYTENPQEAIGDGWLGPWTAILTTLFPSAQRYIVTPHRRPLDPDSHLIIEVMKMTTAPITLRSVLIIAIGNAKHLKPGIPVPERELNRQIDTAFAGTARSKVYWRLNPLDHIGGMVRRRTTDKMCSHSLRGMTPLMTKPPLTTSKL